MFSMKNDKFLFDTMREWFSKGESRKLKFIIKRTKPNELANENGETLMHLAAENGNLSIMAHLISAKCKADVKDSSNQTPLLLAARNKHWEAMKFLLKYNVDIFAKDDEGAAPLSEVIGIYEPNVEVLQIFLDRVKSKSSDKKELLNILREYGCRLRNIIHLHDAELTEMFLSAPDADVSEPKCDGCCIDIAMRSIDEDNMRVLLHHAERQEYSRLAFLFCLRKVLLESCHDESLSNALNVAVKQLVKWKLLHDKRSILKIESIYREMPEVCLRYMLDESLVTYIKSDLGYDIRMQLFGNRNPCVFEMILNGEADMSSLARKGRTALHIAVQGSAVETMEYLLENGVDPNVTEDNGKTPIFKVHHGNHVDEECLTLLLKYGADLQTTDNFGNTYIDCYHSPDFSHDLIKIVIAHLAILEVFGEPLKESFRNYVFSSDERLDYFQLCCQQLEQMKIQQVHSSLPLFEILTENLKDLIRRARPIDHRTIDIFFRSSTVHEYNSYYVSMARERLEKAVTINNLRDEAAAVIADSIQVFKTYFLVIEKICSFLSYYDLRVFKKHRFLKLTYS